MAMPRPETFRPGFVWLSPIPPKIIARGQIPNNPNTNAAILNPLVCGAGSCKIIVWGGAVLVVVARFSGFPQFRQKTSPSTFGFPQFEQYIVIFAP
jgi:hypothetical protein